MKKLRIASYENKLLLNKAQGYLFSEGDLFDITQIEAEYPVGILDSNQVTLVILASKPSQFILDLEDADLRSLLSVSKSEQEYVVLSRAAQLVTWHNEHQFCGRCGVKMHHHSVDLAKHCPACELTQYPRISPCIIVLVMKGDECLLARSPRFPPGRFSTLAGFIEAGESAESAVHREIKEEVGIDVKNVRYVQSQSWPFPHSLMLGFFADYAAGVLKPDGEEIVEAHWYKKDQLPNLPPSFTISRALIDRFVKGTV